MTRDRVATFAAGDPGNVARFRAAFLGGRRYNGVGSGAGGVALRLFGNFWGGLGCGVGYRLGVWMSENVKT